MQRGNFHLTNAVSVLLIVLAVLGWGRKSAAEEVSSVSVKLQQRGAWHIAESVNFSIWVKSSSADAVALADRCENLRSQLQQTWCAAGEAENWSLPCVLVLHPAQAEFTRAVSAGNEKSTGCTTVTFDAGRVIFRRIDLRQDALAWQENALPHELTHVILADLFPNQTLPTWLNEGLATMSEHPSLRGRRQEVLLAAWKSGQMPTLQSLTSQAGSVRTLDANLMYASSSSFLHFLAQERDHDTLLQFAREVINTDCERAARVVFELNGMEELQQRWYRHVERQISTTSG